MDITVCFLLFSFRIVDAGEHVMLCSHCLQVDLDRGMEGRLVQVNFSAAFDRVSHCGLLYKLMSIGVGR